MHGLASLIATLHLITSLVGTLWMTMVYPDDLSLLQAIIVIIWLVCGVVLIHRYLELESAAGHSGFQWMKEVLLEASREDTDLR